MIKFRCPFCLLKLKLPDEISEDSLTCPACESDFETPSPQYFNKEMVDKYEIDMLLGHGNAGEVYLARDAIMDKTVALKLLIDFGQIDSETHQRFLREAQTLSALEHPNIIQAFNAGRYEHGFFIAMTYVDGFTVKSLLQKDSERFTEEFMLKICYKIADAMDYAWEKGAFVHRDIKPANVMICRSSNNIYLTDLGLAKSVNSSVNITNPQLIVGSPFYMSPEQITASTVDFRSDIYSLGATLYHMASGVPPYHGMTMDQIILKKHNTLPKDIKDVNEDISEGLER
ncbi:MAG: serine/threonine protein kinase, partial [Lentisphaeraceae bacterium]|nr:serine/threonine protein kinase [Lentisphaeraceae bacterium]